LATGLEANVLSRSDAGADLCYAAGCFIRDPGLLQLTISAGGGYHHNASLPWLLRLALSILMLMVLLHACSVITEEIARKTLLSLLILPLSHERLLLELAWGVVWRYRGILAVTLIPWLETIFFDSFSMVLIAGTLVSQLAFLIMAAFALSLVLKTALRVMMVLVTLIGAMSLFGVVWLHGASAVMMLVPFQTYPHPFVRLEGATQLVALLGYWGCLGSGPTCYSGIAFIACLNSLLKPIE
jgi:hypothetical protein